MNHSENCGKCHGNHWYGIDCKGVLLETIHEVIPFNCTEQEFAITESMFKIFPLNKPLNNTMQTYEDLRKLTRIAV